MEVPTQWGGWKSFHGSVFNVDGNLRSSILKSNIELKRFHWESDAVCGFFRGIIAPLKKGDSGQRDNIVKGTGVPTAAGALIRIWRGFPCRQLSSKLLRVASYILYVSLWESLLFPCFRQRANSLCFSVSAGKRPLQNSLLGNSFFSGAVPSVHCTSIFAVSFLDREGLPSNYTTNKGKFVTGKVWKTTEECLRRKVMAAQTPAKEKKNQPAVLDPRSKSMHLLSWFHVYRSC